MSPPHRGPGGAGSAGAASNRAAAAAYASSYTPRGAPAFSDAEVAAEEPVLASGSALETVRQLRRPSYEEMLRRDPDGARFWFRYGGLLGDAWKEWEERSVDLPALSDDTVLRPEVVTAFSEAWQDPSKEDAVRSLWEEIAPGVFKMRFFDPERAHILREWFDKARESGVPCRPPYGITLNRQGFMLDERSEGYLAIPSFQEFYRDLIDSYMRPSGRLLYPQYINAEDDSESFAFSIQYQPSKDEEIRQHSDASALTFNVNMNLPDEEWSGSSLYFIDPSTGKKKHVSFGLGEAIVHRGATPHAALPITSGTRSNLVMWLYGEEMSFNRFAPYSPQQQLTREQRWTKPAKKSTDKSAPF